MRERSSNAEKARAIYDGFSGIGAKIVNKVRLRCEYLINSSFGAKQLFLSLACFAKAYNWQDLAQQYHVPEASSDSRSGRS